MSVVEAAPSVQGGLPASDVRRAELPQSSPVHSEAPAAPSVRERMAAGKTLREKVPHHAHAVYQPGRDRQDPVAILEEQAKTRLPFLIPIRYARMLASPFAFLRGSAAVMAADLAQTPSVGIRVQACGDMHVANFGVFASAERNLVFGINDFDETMPGPWEWDLKRLAASVVVATRFLGGDGVIAQESVQALVRTYRKRMREFAEMRYLDVWYARIDERGIFDVLTPEARKGAERIINKARQRGHVQVLSKMAELIDDKQRIVESAPLIVREQTTSDGRPIWPVVAQVLTRYTASLPEDRKELISRYRVIDVARKVVGVGSVGTRCWVLLMMGNGSDDPLFLQYKEVQPSVLAPYLKARRFKSEGQRVVVGQRLIQGAPDVFLGWGTLDHTHFYVRQLRDMKGGVDFSSPATKVSNMPSYAKLCGWALAMAHAKSGDAAMIAGYIGKTDAMDEAIARFADAYADQTESDHEALAKAARRKKIPVAAAE
jgi:uncharacterized protein (DUF2252 family)